VIDLSIVIVSYNARMDLERCLQSLHSPTPSRSHEIIVVDNASTDGSAEAARRWRKAVQFSGLSPSGRRRFWRAFAAFAVSNAQREPAPSDFDALLRTTEDQATVAEAGSITLVGAGPGDAELLTMRAVRALQSADIILIDDLLAPDILDFARREAKMALVGKTGRLQQDEVTLMIALAKGGRRVVGLKGGSSPPLGREVIAACRRAGIAIEVVPGVTVGGARGETERNRVERVSDRVKNWGRLAPIPETPLRACCGWPAVRPARRARALRSTSRG